MCDPHLHVQIHVGVLVVGGWLAILGVHQVDPAALRRPLRVHNLPPHTLDGLRVRGHALLRLRHQLAVPLRVHQLAL